MPQHHYLLRGSGCGEHDHARELDGGAQHERVRSSPRATAGWTVWPPTSPPQWRTGEPAGRWGGWGLDLFGVRPGEAASEGMVRSVFRNLQEPASGEALGRAPRKFKTSEERVEAALAPAGPEVTPEQRRQLEVAATAARRWPTTT